MTFADSMQYGGLFSQTYGAASGAVGSYFSGQVQKINLKSQQHLAEVNARIAELGAQSALLQGQQQVASLTLKAGQLKGRQRASLAANGVDLGVGNAAEIQASTDIMKTIDTNQIEANALRSALGYRSQAANYMNEATTARATASAISPFGMFGSSLLGSAGTVAQSWYNLHKQGK